MRNVLIVGAGRVGRSVAAESVAAGHRTAVLDSEDRWVDWPPDVVVARHAGSGTDVDALERAGVRRCDAVIVAAESDAVTLVAATLAKFEFGVPLVVARVIDPAHRWLFGADLGVDVVVDDARLVADVVTESLARAVSR